LMLVTVAIVRSLENYPLFTFRIIVTVPLDCEDDTNDRDCAQELSFMLSLNFIRFDNTCLAALWKI